MYHIYSITETTVGKTKSVAIVDLVHICSNISSIKWDCIIVSFYVILTIEYLIKEWNLSPMILLLSSGWHIIPS